jgi:hypothetical protein
MTIQKKGKKVQTKSGAGWTAADQRWIDCLAGWNAEFEDYWKEIIAPGMDAYEMRWLVEVVVMHLVWRHADEATGADAVELASKQVQRVAGYTGQEALSKKEVVALVRDDLPKWKAAGGGEAWKALEAEKRSVIEERNERLEEQKHREAEAERRRQEQEAEDDAEIAELLDKNAFHMPEWQLRHTLADLFEKHGAAGGTRYHGLPARVYFAALRLNRRMAADDSACAPSDGELDAEIREARQNHLEKKSRLRLEEVERDRREHEEKEDARMDAETVPLFESTAGRETGERLRVIVHALMEKNTGSPGRSVLDDKSERAVRRLNARCERPLADEELAKLVAEIREQRFAAWRKRHEEETERKAIEERGLAAVESLGLAEREAPEELEHLIDGVLEKLVGPRS